MSLSRLIFSYPDPDKRFLKWIRIRTRPNDTDPTGSGSETLLKRVKKKRKKVKDIKRVPADTKNLII